MRIYNNYSENAYKPFFSADLYVPCTYKAIQHIDATFKI